MRETEIGLSYSNPQKKSAKFKLFKDFQFYSRFSSLLISRSYLIPTVTGSPKSEHHLGIENDDMLILQHLQL